MIGANGGWPPRILGIGGSMRAGSRNRALLEAALRLAREAGAVTMLADVRELDLPLFYPGQDAVDGPPSLAWLLDEVRAADAYLFCSPTYHGTVSGAVKNALDALELLGDGYLEGKPVGLLACGGPSVTNTLNALHHAARALKGLSVPTIVAVPGGGVEPLTGEVRDEAVRRRLVVMVDEVLNLSRRLRAPAVVGVG